MTAPDADVPDLTGPGATAPKRRGRPADVDPERVALLALRHFAERGYEETTMDDIAALAGIGRRTLFRYFPSKPALVWGGIEPVVGRMHEVLDAPPDGRPVAAVLAEAVTAAFTLPPEAEEATRRRLTLMGTHPALVGFGVTAMGADRDLLIGFLSSRLGADAQALRVQVLADALSAAIFSALVWWASHDDGPPAPTVVAALADLLRGL